MKRTKKIHDLWKNLPKNAANAYVAPNVNKDTQWKKKILSGLIKLDIKAKVGLAANDPEGIEFLQLRDRTGVVMRNYCRSLKNIKNKVYFKRVKGLTAAVMSLQLGQLDAEDGLGSEAALEALNASAVDAALLQGDEAEPDAELLEGEKMEQGGGNADAQQNPVGGNRQRTMGGTASPNIAQHATAKVQQPNTTTTTTTQPNVGPPQRPTTDAPVVIPPKVLRERSQAAMAQYRKQHNTDRKNKLAELAEPGLAYFKTNVSTKLGALSANAGPEFTNMMAALKAAETNPSPQNIATLESNAQAYKNHFDQSVPETDKANPLNKARKLVCDGAQQAVALVKVGNELQALGDPANWTLREENHAAALYTKLLFESGDKVLKKTDNAGEQPRRTEAQPNKTDGKTTANASWWVERHVGGFAKADKKFIFKPAELESEVVGFPRGGSACREVLGAEASRQLQALTGLDFGAPETLLVKVGKDRLAGYDGPGGTAESVGSMQHFSKTDGEIGDLARKDPTILARIPSEECQKMAILDLVSLNTDRHAGNFLIAGADSDTPRLVPIDHGLVLPSRAGLNDRSNRMGPPSTALSLIPGSEEPFTAEMAALVQAIDPAEVVKGLKAAQADMVAQHPEVAQKAEIGEENFDLVARSCHFLKAGVAAGLSPAELLDGYQHFKSKIFDTPGVPTPQDPPAAKVFAEVIQEVKARSQQRQLALQAIPRDDGALAQVQADLLKLGWDVPDNMSGDGLKELLFENPQLMQCQKGKIPSKRGQLIKQEIAETLAKFDQLNFPRPNQASNVNDRDFLAFIQKKLVDVQVDADEQKLKTQKFPSNSTKDAYKLFIADGGNRLIKKPDAKDPMKNLDVYMDELEDRWTKNGLAARLKNWCPDMVLDPPPVQNRKKPTEEEAKALLVWRTKNFKAFHLWEQFEHEGGVETYEKLGCQSEVPVDAAGLAKRLDFIRKAKKLKEELSNLPPLRPTQGPQVVQPNPVPQRVQPTQGNAGGQRAQPGFANQRAQRPQPQPVQTANQDQPGTPNVKLDDLNEKKRKLAERMALCKSLGQRIDKLAKDQQLVLRQKLLAGMKLATEGQPDEADRLLAELDEEVKSVTVG